MEMVIHAMVMKAMAMKAMVVVMETPVIVMVQQNR